MNIAKDMLDNTPTPSISSADPGTLALIRAIVDAAQEPMLVLDLQCQPVLANAACEALFGPVAAGNSHLAQRDGAFWRDSALPAFLKQLCEGAPAEPITLRLGSAELRLRGRRVPAPTNTLLLLAFEAISAAPAPEDIAAARTSRERLELAQRAGRIGTFEWLVQENQVIWTPELEELYGLPPGGFEGKYENWAQRVHPADRAAAEANLAAAVQGGPPYDVEFRVLWPDGSERWMLAKGDVTFDAQGQATRVVGVNFDITERKIVADALAERRQQLELALDAANMGSWQWHVASQSLLCSPTCKAHFGLPADVEIDYHVILERIDPADTEALQHTIYRALTEKSAFGSDFRVQWPDGSRHWLRAAGRLITGDDSSARMAGITLDITDTMNALDERARTLEREQTMRGELEQALHLRDEFLSVASHELKTPLTSMLGNAQLLQRRLNRETTVSPANQHTLNVIINQSRRLERMINDLLDITRISKGRLSIEAQRFDLALLIQQVVEEVQPTLYLNHTVVADLRTAPLMIAGDALRLEQVLQNLIQNAVKYSPNGGMVTVRLEQVAAFARISVIDKGIGIPAVALPELFSQFYRASNVQAQQISGMGIGLYVVKEIVEMHSGTVRVESREGEGSTFTIDLPLESTAAG